MPFSVGTAPPSQIGGFRVSERSEEGSTSQKEGEGEKVEDHSQSTARARPSRVGERAHGKTVQGIQASGRLLEGDIVCPDYGCIRHRGTNDGRVDPLSDIGAGTPVALRSREQGIEEALSLAGLVVDVVVHHRRRSRVSPRYWAVVL